MKAAVVIIMSTYNGVPHLRLQIESVLSQRDVDVRLVVRDDGSTDATRDILKEYENRDSVTVIYGENVGIIQSFFTALGQAGDADYYAFCDQDDYWEPDKIATAVQRLEEQEPRDSSRPMLYCSELRYCDGLLTPQSTSNLNVVGVTFQNMLFEVISSGNTMVMNSALRNLVMSHPYDGACGYDWWVGLIATCFGEVVWDTEPHLLYRRTGSNASPSGMGFVALQLFRVKELLMGGRLLPIRQQIEYFLTVFGDEMDDSTRELLNSVIGTRKSKRALLPGRFRQKILDEVLLRLLFAVRAV